jgi:hypothetical protein
MENLEKEHDDQETMRLVVHFLKAGSINDRVGFKNAIDAEFTELLPQQKFFVGVEQARNNLVVKLRQTINAHKELKDLNGIVPEKLLHTVKSKIQQIKHVRRDESC